MYLFHCKKIYTHIFILYGFLLTWESNSMRYKKTTSSLCSLMAACRGCLVLLLNMAYSKGAVMWEKSSGVKSFCGGQRHSRNEWWETIGCIKWAIKWSTTEYIWKWKQEQLKRVDDVHRSNLMKGLDTFRSFLLYFFLQHSFLSCQSQTHYKTCFSTFILPPLSSPFYSSLFPPYFLTLLNFSLFY